jgi:hypothetical protein
MVRVARYRWQSAVANGNPNGDPDAGNLPRLAQEAFAVIRDAMRHKAMVALGRLVLAKRERVIALEPYDKGLLGTTLRYP